MCMDLPCPCAYMHFPDRSVRSPNTMMDTSKFSENFSMGHSYVAVNVAVKGSIQRPICIKAMIRVIVNYMPLYLARQFAYYWILFTTQLLKMKSVNALSSPPSLNDASNICRVFS